MHPDTYQKYLTERSKEAMLAKAERGVFPGCAPLGYKNVVVNGEKVVVVDPVTAPKVRRLFELATRKRMTLGKLAAEAEGLELRSRNGALLGGHAIRVILRNRFYLGQLSYGGRQFPGRHTGLVSTQIFDLVQPTTNRRKNI